MSNEGGFLWRVHERCKGDSEAVSVAVALIMAGDLDDRQLSNRELADRTGLDRRTVADRIKRLEDEGILPKGDAPSKPLNFK